MLDSSKCAEGASNVRRPSEGNPMNEHRLGGRPLWPIALLLVLLAAAVALVGVLATGSSGGDHGRQLALYGAGARAAAEKAGESEAGARKGAEEGEVPGRGRDAGEKGE